MSRTYHPSKRKRKRAHGFLKRARAHKNVLSRRRSKKRKRLSV